MIDSFHQGFDEYDQYNQDVDHAGGLTRLSKDSLQVVVAELHSSASVWVPDLKMGLGSGMGRRIIKDVDGDDSGNHYLTTWGR